MSVPARKWALSKRTGSSARRAVLNCLADWMIGENAVECWPSIDTIVFEPFLLGTTTAGRSALRAYQTAGGSRSGTVPGWHLFSLGKIVGLATCQKRFSGV
mgnify:CR=1 FL=1